MTLYKTADAEFPPSAEDGLPPGIRGWLGYIGGNDLKVYTKEQWQPFAHLRQFPIWGCQFGIDPGTQAAQAVNAAMALGWSRGRAIIGDCEALSDRSWWRGFETTLRLYDFHAVCYGSVDFVTENHAQSYLGALWDDIPSLDNLPELPPGESWLGKQYQNNVSFGSTKLDYSVITRELFLMGGVNARS